MFKILQPIRGYIGGNSLLNSFHLNRCCGYSTAYTKTSNKYVKRDTKQKYTIKKISDPKSKKANVIQEQSPPPPSATPPTIVSSTIGSKQDTLNYFTRLSDRLHAEFTRYPYISSLKYLNTQLFVQNCEQETFVALAKSIRQSSDFIQSVQYLNSNLSEYTPKEKAILFKMLAMLASKISNGTSGSQSDASFQLVRNVLLSLEIDYYTLNLSEDLNLVDLVNYRDGFYCYRDQQMHFIQASTECLYEKLVETVEAFFEGQKDHQPASTEIGKINEAF